MPGAPPVRRPKIVDNFFITLVQMAPTLVREMGLAEKSANIERVAALLSAERDLRSGSSTDRWTDLVVLPEFCFDGPSSTLASLAISAEHLSGGPALDACSSVATRLQAAIVTPVYLEESGSVFNSCIVVGTEVAGERVYRKVHTFPPEVGRVKRGDAPVIALVRSIPVGLQICYDLAFPESARILRLRGAQIIVYPTMAPDWLMTRFQILAAARAIENQVFVVVVNSVGHHPRTGERLGGGSTVAWPDGRTLLLGEDETVCTVGLDLEELKSIRAELDLVRDRSPSSYAGLVDG